MILTISRYILCGIIFQIMLGAPQGVECCSSSTELSGKTEIYTYNHADCEDMKNGQPIIVSVSKESEKCNKKILDALMVEMTNATIARANEISPNNKSDIVCGGSYQISRNSDEGKCILDFQGTAGNKSMYNRGIFGNELWEWLVFACVAIIATVEMLSALKQIYEWKNEGQVFICGDDNSSLGSGKS